MNCGVRQPIQDAFTPVTNAGKRYKLTLKPERGKTNTNYVNLFNGSHIHYWRDKRGHEIDFVLARRNQPPTAIECKWSASDFDPSNVMAFRRHYRKGKTFVVATDVDRSYHRSSGEIEIAFVNLESLIRALVKADNW